MSNFSLPDVSSTEPADALEALWAQPGDAPDLGAFLAGHPSWSPDELRVALLVDQQFRSRTPQPWNTEDYLGLVPALAADDELTLDLIFGECRGRSRQGIPPALDELVRRFPHLATRLQRQMEIASWFTGAADEQHPPEDDRHDPQAIRFGDYDLHEEIARGGMGVIYRARHRKLKRTVALKMIRPERLMRPADLRRFNNETRIIAQLDHPNIIPILNVDQFDGVHFFTMRMIEGRDLDVRRDEYLNDAPRAAQLVSAVAAAIHYAHQHGVLHRDLKPSNVLVDESGVPFVVDFGLARHVSEVSDLTMPDEFLGTPAYAAPELLQPDAPLPSVAADVYGLGAILYVLLTGQPPYAGRNAFEVWEKVRDSRPRPPRTLNASVDRDLESICLKALEKNPAARYASAAELAEDLDRYLAGEAVTARPFGWRQRRRRWLRKYAIGRRLAVTAAVAFSILLAVIVVLSISLHHQMKQTDAARQEAESHRRALQAAEERADRLQPDAAANQPRSAGKSAEPR